MNPILEIIEEKLIHSPKSTIFQYIGASNITADYYSHKKLERIWALAPYSDNYFSVLNPLFSKVYLELVKKGHHFPVVLLRDGVIDLLEFVTKNPDPLVFEQRFMIHQKLSYVLPRAWLDQVMLFDFYHKPQNSFRIKTLRKRLIISTIVNNFFISYDQIRVYFESLAKFARDQQLEVQLHFPIRENHYFKNAYKDQNQAFDISLIAFEIFGTQTKIISDKSLKSSSDFRDCYYAFIPEDRLCLSDNYLEHYLLINGAAPWKGFKEINGAYQVSLSSQHGVYLFDALSEHYESSKYTTLEKLDETELFHFLKEHRYISL